MRRVPIKEGTVSVPTRARMSVAIVATPTRTGPEEGSESWSRQSP